jgi:hypothetical protein
MKFTTRIAVLLSAFVLPVLPAVAQAPVAAVAQAEDAKLRPSSMANLPSG